MTLLEAAEKALSALEFMRDDPDTQAWCPEADDAILALHKALHTIDHDVVADLRKKWTTAIEKDGGHCPVCDKWGKIYKVKLTQGLALALRWIMVHGDAEGWVNVQTHGPRWMMRSKVYPLLMNWGLIESRGYRSGVWRATPYGRDFVLGLANADSAAYIYDNKVHGWSGVATSFRGCFGKHFDFDEMMSERFDWASIKLRGKK